MTHKNRYFPLALLTSLLAAPMALAGHDDDDDDRRERRRPRTEVHVHTHGCDHGPGPMPASQGPGRYELRSVNVWVPGYEEEVWVPQVCKYKPHKNRTKCRGGYYERQWVEGHYEPRQQWVWVPAPVHHAPVVYPAPPPPGRPGWSVRVGIDL